MSFAILKAVAASQARKAMDIFKAAPEKAPTLPLGLRLGGTLAIDETPFILGAGKFKLGFPGPRHVISAHGRIDMNGMIVDRLYLENAGFMLQIVTTPDGKIAECRLFGTLDTITPGSRDDWSFWLDEDEGAIGYPAFQTQDGTLYQRVWSSGEHQTEPVEMEETIRFFGATGQGEEEHQSMLYGRDVGDGLEEFVLLDAVRSEDEAWVEILSGFDVNPASLSAI